jgi:hypothetical protein
MEKYDPIRVLGEGSFGKVYYYYYYFVSFLTTYYKGIPNAR